MIDDRKITQVANYLLSRDSSDTVDELKIVKMIWAADRYHIRKYAKLVTFDDYYAMKDGPVGSAVKDVLEFSDYRELDIDYISRFIRKLSINSRTKIKSVSSYDQDELSKTDIEALDFAWNNMGSMTTKEAVDFTHKYPEWKDHEGLVKYGGRKKIDISRMFDNPDYLDFADPFVSQVEKSRLDAARIIFFS